MQVIQVNPGGEPDKSPGQQRLAVNIQCKLSHGTPGVVSALFPGEWFALIPFNLRHQKDYRERKEKQMCALGTAFCPVAVSIDYYFVIKRTHAHNLHKSRVAMANCKPGEVIPSGGVEWLEIISVYTLLASVSLVYNKPHRLYHINIWGGIFPSVCSINIPPPNSIFGR